LAKFFEALKRYEAEQALEHTPVPETRPVRNLSAVEMPALLTPVPVGPAVPGHLARADGIRHLTEKIAPLACLNSAIRLGISGCRPGDGASSVAASIAIDLSQRLALRILLLDAHLRHPSLFRMFSISDPMIAEATPSTRVLIRPTRWPRLDVASCMPPAEREHQQRFFEDTEQLINRYPIVVIDLGVLRLDARMLPLARATDPILLIVRYGYTERRELATTATALAAANRQIGGVVLNARRRPAPAFVDRIFGTGA
jgi:Mrp family chromosome partitioning ATPase